MLPEFLQKILERLAHGYYAKRDPGTCEHSWVVCGTAHAQVCLELYCQNCAITGVVNDPSQEEWDQAYGSISNPYPWSDGSRVTVGTARVL